VPDLVEMRRDLDVLDSYRTDILRRKNAMRTWRQVLEGPPVAQLV